MRLGFVGRLKQVESVRFHERLGEYQAEQLATEQRLQALKRPFRPEVLAALQPWADQYSADQLRYKFLVLRGGSRTGKSTLAKSLGDVYGWGSPYIQTVQGAPAPDLKEFDKESHGYILFDNVNDMQFVLDYRALVQSNNSVHTLGQSQTGMYAYRVWVYKVPIVMTVDDSAVWNSHEPWIRENMFELVLRGPCYE